MPSMTKPKRESQPATRRGVNHRSKQEFFKSRRDQQQRGAKPDAWDADAAQRAPYDNIEKTSAKLEGYYRLQQLFGPPGEAADAQFDAMLAAFRRGLPTTFRFTGTKAEALDARDFMLNSLLPEIDGFAVDGVAMQPPRPLPWFPHQLAWHFDFPRAVLRRSPELRRFHQYMISETEMGNISRQEAVSMIPVQFLDVQPHHYVLDTCASPGSKTVQIIEAMHTNVPAGEMPAGLVVANDANYRRAAMLVHQTHRVASPALIVTNHEAQHFPAIHLEGADSRLAFDRILCDVPCSGDGTLRKNVDVWRSWTSSNGNTLHRTQLQILMRAVQLLRVGGRIVYSTCSMNPVEDEAVVAEALRRSHGTLRLVDCSEQLPALKRHRGLATWSVVGKDMQQFASLDAVSPVAHKNKSLLVPSLYAPAPGAAEALELQKCMRFYPHDQDTGAFFVAVLEKTCALPEGKRYSIQVGRASVEEVTLGEPADQPSTAQEPAVQEPAAKKARQENEDEDEDAIGAKDTMPDRPEVCSRRPRNIATRRRADAKPHVRGWYASDTYSEEPFIFVPPTHPDVAVLKEYFGLVRGAETLVEFPTDLLLVRGDRVEPEERLGQVYVVSQGVMRALTAIDASRLRIVNCGVKVWSRNDKLVAHLVEHKQKLMAQAGDTTEAEPARINLLRDRALDEIEAVCPFRLHSDGLPTVSPFLSTRTIAATRADLVLALRKMTPRIVEFSPSVQERARTMVPGAAVLRWDPAVEADGASASPEGMAMHCPIAVSMWLGFSGVNLYVGKHERRSLYLRLTGDMLSDRELSEIGVKAKVSAEASSEVSAEAPGEVSAEASGEVSAEAPGEVAKEEENVTTVQEE